MPKPTFKDFQGYLEKHKNAFPPNSDLRLEPPTDQLKAYRKSSGQPIYRDDLYWALVERQLEILKRLRALPALEFEAGLRVHLLREARKWLRRAWTEWLCEYLDE